MTSMVHFEGTLWREGDRNPAVVTGGIKQDDNRYYREVTLGDRDSARAMATPADWRLLPQRNMLLRVTVSRRPGDVFAFEGEINVERTDLTFAKRAGDVFEFVQGGTAAFAKPQDAVYLTVIGNDRIEPPKAQMSKEEVTAWLRSLKAVDGLRHSLSTDV